ncbi:MAG: glycosyltransferase [Candidatus Desulfofervidaceae bacterium]|nr:glycosyltransferase [Candidatus Desulfofervidaceae bacterium]
MAEIIGVEINPDQVKKADIIVGIPSYNEADTIAFPVKQAAEGLKQYFSGYKSVIINCDANSTDGTKEVFLNTPTGGVPKIYLSTPLNVSGKGSVLKMLFHKACEMEAKAILTVDADLISITPKWIRNLGEPLFEDFGFVAPLYVRHKYDGTITNNVVYPLTRALYGRRIRQPIGGDFSFSGELAKIYAQSPYWDNLVERFGIDIWMSTLAINQGIPICQSFMGRPKIHRPKDPAKTLGSMFYQVVGTVFNLMQRFEENWKKVKWSKPTAIFGFGLGETELPPPVEVDQKSLYQKFNAGFEKYASIWEKILFSPNLIKLKEIKTLQLERFEFPTELWIKILYDFAVAFKNKCVEEGLMLESLVPLYFGKTLSFVKKTERMSIQEAEELIEYECEAFEKIKPYLIQRWEET